MPLTLPAGACNAHCHVFGPRERFPYPPDASYVPEADAPKEALFALNDRLGLQRCVIVQAACHGRDHRAVEDAIAQRPAHYRGVALVAPDVADAELQRLHRAGFRAARFNHMRHLGAGASAAQQLALAGRLADLGWHLQLHGDPERVLMDIGPALAGSPVPVVIDHLGRIDAGLGPSQPAFEALRRLLDNPRFWVKLSGLDRSTRLGPPYDDALPYARQLMADAGDRVLWGNDWPHPNHPGPLPDEQQLVDVIEAFAPTAAQRQALLVDNPQRLYGFGD